MTREEALEAALELVRYQHGGSARYHIEQALAMPKDERNVACLDCGTRIVSCDCFMRGKQDDNDARLLCVAEAVKLEARDVVAGACSDCACSTNSPCAHDEAGDRALAAIDGLNLAAIVEGVK